MLVTSDMVDTVC